jgi:hypothetical protein
VVLAGGPLRAAPVTLLASSRLGSSLAGRPGIAGTGEVGRPLLGLNALDGRAGPLPSGPLGSVGRLRAERPHRIGDAVGVSVLLNFGGGLAPGPPASG